MKKEKHLLLLSIGAALLVAILIISASVTITLFDRSSYTSDISSSGLPERTGMSEEEILANYNALIDYNSVFFIGPLEFPSLPISDNGREHFREVKVIFSAFQIAFIISAICLIPLCIILIKKRKTGFLLGGGILAIAVPAFVGLIMAVAGWDRFFLLFHQLMFNNDFWIFDELSDPVILILPDSFFLQCLIKIIAGIVIPAIILIIISSRTRYQTGSRSPRLTVQ